MHHQDHIVHQRKRTPGPMPSAVLCGIWVSFLCSGCAQEQYTIIGVARDPSQGCAEVEIEYRFTRPTDEVVPTEIPPDWCAVMEGNPRVVCFLLENNMQENGYLNRPRTLPHTAVDPSHPDLSCWTEQLAEWDNDYGGGGDPYHPVWNNGD